MRRKPDLRPSVGLLAPERAQASTPGSSRQGGGPRGKGTRGGDRSDNTSAGATKGRCRGGQFQSLHVAELFCYVRRHVVWPARLRIPEWYPELWGCPQKWLRTKHTELSYSQRLLTSLVRLSWFYNHECDPSGWGNPWERRDYVPMPLHSLRARGGRPSLDGVASTLRVLARRILRSTLAVGPRIPVYLWRGDQPTDHSRLWRRYGPRKP